MVTANFLWTIKTNNFSGPNCLKLSMKIGKCHFLRSSTWREKGKAVENKNKNSSALFAN